MLLRKHVFLLLMPPRYHCLLYALGRAAGLLHGSLEGLVGDDDIVELVLRDDVDRVRICSKLDGSPEHRCAGGRTDADD